MTCLTCHVAHPNGQPHLLRKLQPAARAAAHRGLDPVSAFCVACHARAAEFERSGGHYGRHPVGVRVRSGLLDAPPGLDVPLVDVRGTADPSDDVVSCATCHRVHAGSNAFLLRWDLEDLPAACRSCHAVDGDVGPSGAPAAIAARRR
jgi:predicted CXXCH cytochrome family protein